MGVVSQSAVSILVVGVSMMVSADAQTIKKADIMEEVVVTASGFENTLSKAPASISVLDPTEIKQQPIKDLVDALKALPGVSNHISQGGRNGIVIRGLDEDYVLRLVDGTRISSSTGIWRRNNFDNTPVPLAIIDRVEVVRGPMSALYGSDAVGGVVNVITRKPDDEWINNISAETSVMHEGRGGDRWRVGYLGSGKVSDDIGLTFSAEKSKQDTWHFDPIGVPKGRTTEYSALEPREASKYAASLGWQLAENQALNVDIARDIDQVLYSFFGNYARHQEIKRWSYSVKHSGDWSWGRSELLFSQSDAKMEDFNTRYIDNPNTDRNEQFFYPNEVYTTLRGVSHFELGGHTLTAGVEYLETEVTDDIQYPVNGKESLSLSSIFLQDQFDITGNFTATLGLRAEDAEAYGFHVTPRAYLVYDFGDGITVKGGVGSAFRAPTLFEASENFQSLSCGGRCFIYGNPELKEETSVSTELSLLINRASWSASVTLFNNDVDELIETGRYGAGHPRARNVTYFNLDEATLRGAEVSVGLDISENLTLNANYSYLEAFGPDDRALAYRPEHKANLKLNYELNQAAEIYLNAHYYGDYVHYRRRDITAYEQAAYTLVDLGLRFQATDSVLINAGITNLTATQPIEKDADSDLHLQGRAAFLRAEYTF